jgi:hypothetical protein
MGGGSGFMRPVIAANTIPYRDQGTATRKLKKWSLDQLAVATLVLAALRGKG